MQRDWLTTQEAADLLGLSAWTLAGAVRSGVLRAERHAGRRWRIARDDLERWVLSTRVTNRLMAPRRDRYVSPDRRPHVELLDETGLSDDSLAELLGVSRDRVRRWREHGVPNLYVARLRRIAGQAAP